MQSDFFILDYKNVLFTSVFSGFEIHNGKLYENGNYVQHRNRNKALRSFLEYCEETAAGDQVVLVAHNGKCFAFNKLLQEIEEAGLDQDFERIVQGQKQFPFFQTKYNKI